MTKDRVRELARLLPDDAILFNPGKWDVHATRQRLAHRVADATNDPDFGHEFVMNFVLRAKPLPATVHEVFLRRAYSHHALSSPITDSVMMGVEQLRSPRNNFTRQVLHALLICRDATHTQIAEWLSLDEEVIRIYEQIHFNVRDRADEKLYIGRIVFPEGRLQMLATDAVQNLPVGQRLLHAGNDYGAQEVLWQAGMSTQSDPPSLAQGLKLLEETILDHAMRLTRVGCLNSKSSPGINHAKTLLAAKNDGGGVIPGETSDYEAGLGALNIGPEEALRITGGGPGESIRITQDGINDHSDYLARVQASTFEDVSLEKHLNSNPANKR